MQKANYGSTIAHYRKKQGLTQASLGSLAGLPQNTVSNIEGGKVKSGVRAVDMVRISQALEEPEVLAAFCQACPVRPYLFPDGIQADPVAALEKLRGEMEAAAVLATDLFEKLADPEFQKSPEFSAGVAQVKKITGEISALEQGIRSGGCVGGCR